MRIIAFSDIHNAYDQVEEILLREKEYDIILISGDITTFGTPSDAQRSIEQFRVHGKPVLAVAGNMDSQEIDYTLRNIGCSIGGRGVIIENTGFFGVSAAPYSPLHTPYEISEEEIRQKAETGWNDIKNAQWKIFVPHAPPYNTKLDRILTGKHVGSTAVRTFIETHQPDLVVCGHIHEARGTDRLGITQMINCGTAAKGQYSIIEIGTNILMENRR